MPCRKVAPDGIRSTGKKTVLTKDQREEVLRRLATGETQQSVADDFKVTRAAISLIKQRTADPERFAGKYTWTKRLDDNERATFIHTINTTTPVDHGLDVYGPQPMRHWTMQRGFELVKQLFGKRPSIPAMKECLGDHLKRRPDDYLTPPDPPRPFDIRRLSPDMLDNKDFIRYCQTEAAWELEQREYKFALAQYHERLAAMQKRLAAETGDSLPPEFDDDEPVDDAAPLSHGRPPAYDHEARPGLRTGKHAKSKGSPFTKPKRRKKRR